MTKGRNCSFDYVLNKDWVKDISYIDNEAIYIVGGLYGNYYALEKIKEFASFENKPLIIFNGDIHWFDIIEEDFLKIENVIKDDIKLLGNVEYELIRKTNDLGCGCNYPESTSDGIVERSNIIHSLMKKNIKDINILNDISSRKKTLCINALGKKIAITHGDEKNMAGWQCSFENLHNIKRQEELESWLTENKIDMFVTTHTCLPVIKNFAKSFIFNNGSSGMGNIKDSHYGLFVRIAKTSHKEAIVSKKIDDVYIELVKIDYDLDKFVTWFDKVWEKDSPASISYKNRILNGTNLLLEDIEF